MRLERSGECCCCWFTAGAAEALDELRRGGSLGQIRGYFSLLTVFFHLSVNY
jgi:hypothetical protein